MSDHLDPLRDALRGQRTGSWVGAAVFEAFAIGMVLPFSEKFRQAINLAPLDGGAWVLGIFGAGLALYSTINGLFSIGQQIVINRMKDDGDPATHPVGTDGLKNVTPRKGGKR